MTHKIPWQYLVIAIGALALAGCGGGSASGKTEPVAEILFNPLGGAVPSPNDLAFQESEDGTLNAAEVTPTGGTEPLDSQVSVNSTDGFSTLASATARFSVPVDPDTVVSGATVRVFAVATLGDPNTANPPTDPAGPKPPSRGGPTTELTPGTQFIASLSATDPNGTTLAVTPLQPLQPDQTYLIVVTTGIEARGGGAVGASEQYQLVKSETPLVDGGGNSQVADLSDSEAQTLEGVRQLVAGIDIDADDILDGGHIPVIEDNTSLTADDVVASWTFTTQTIGDSLDAVKTIIDGAMPAFADAGGTPNQLTPTGLETPSGGGTSAGVVYAGVLAGVPYYLEPGDTDPTRIRTGFWKQADDSILAPGSETPAANVTLNIPVLVALPKDDGDAPSDVVIFQHGITSDRIAMLGIANALTAANHAVVAIDLPLHGITDTGHGLYTADLERTFDVDLVDNDTGEAGPDGEIDPSGEHFINLGSLQTSRDNLRQAVADLFAVTRAIRLAAGGGADLDVDGDADFTGNISFLGHSLGGIVGVPYLAKETTLDAAVLGMAGGGITKLLDGSPAIGPDLAEGLAANNLVKGTPGYEQFLGAAQLVIDSADPANHAVTGASNHDTLLLEVIGGSSSPPDQVVPNDVRQPFQQGVPDDTIPSPTAGSTPLAELLAGGTINQIDTDPTAAGDYLIRYTAGDHASLLLPDASAEATTEMQTNVTSFIASDGTSVTFAGTSTVDAP